MFRPNFTEIGRVVIPYQFIYLIERGMVIFTVIIAVFFSGIKKKPEIYIFSRNLHLLTFPTMTSNDIYSLPRTRKDTREGPG